MVILQEGLRILEFIARALLHILPYFLLSVIIAAGVNQFNFKGKMVEFMRRKAVCHCHCHSDRCGQPSLLMRSHPHTFCLLADWRSSGSHHVLLDHVTCNESGSFPHHVGEFGTGISFSQALCDNLDGNSFWIYHVEVIPSEINICGLPETFIGQKYRSLRLQSRISSKTTLP